MQDTDLTFKEYATEPVLDMRKVRVTTHESGVITQRACYDS